jgi:prepilin-type N-terminal cleavage/methylation domain-containing protein
VLDNIKKPVKGQNGFTLVEINMSITILAIIMVAILSVFTNYFVLLTRNSVEISMSSDAQNLLRTVTEELRYGAGVRQTNTIADTYGPVGGWNTNNTSFVIITAVPAVNSNEDYIIDPLTGEPYLNELVYYKNGRTMYKRSLANPAATGNKLKTSCPQANASLTCPADIKLAENVQSMLFVLYDQDDASTSNPLLARSVVINLSMLADTFGAPLTLDTSIRTTLRNTF